MTQTIQTTLPQPSDGSNTLQVFVRCTDVLDRHKTIDYPIVIEGGDTVIFSKETTDRFVEVILQSVGNGEEPRVSDLLMLADALSGAMESQVIELDQMKESVETLTMAVASQSSLSPSETTQMSFMLKELTKQIVESQDTEL